MGDEITPDWAAVRMLNVFAIYSQIIPQLIILSSYNGQNAREYSSLLAQIHLTVGAAHFYGMAIFEIIDNKLQKHIIQESLQEIIIYLMKYTFGGDVNLNSFIMNYFDMNYKSLFIPIVLSYLAAWGMSTGKLLVSDVGGVQNIPTYGSVSSIIHFILGIIFMIEAHYS